MDKRANTMEELGKLFKSNPAPWLVGGAGALAAGGLTMMKKREEGESRLGRLGRILANAALVGGATAGGTALMQKGIEGFKTVLPQEDVSMPDRAGQIITDPKTYAAGFAAGLPLAYYGRQHKADQGTLKSLLKGHLGEGVSDPGVFARDALKNRPGMNADSAFLNKLSDEIADKQFGAYQTSGEKAKWERMYRNDPTAIPRTKADFRPGAAGGPSLDGILSRMREAGADPNARGMQRFSQKHLARLTGRSAGQMTKRLGAYGGAIALPFAAAPVLKSLFKDQDPSIYE